MLIATRGIEPCIRAPPPINSPILVRHGRSTNRYDAKPRCGEPNERCASKAVHIGFWSLLRSWLRPHRGISQDKLPPYLGFFQFVHNARRRGKALLGALVAALVA